jgi:hypothetical protein
MISMRYARNLVEGAGLVWNPGGEHVEGYTNFFWVLLMAAFHLLPIGISKISLSIQLFALSLLIVNLFYVRKIALFVSDGSLLVSAGSVFLTAFYHALNNWSLQGMEVALLVTLTTFVLYRIMTTRGQPRIAPDILVAMAVGTLTRTDASILYLALLAYRLIDARRRRMQADVRGIVVVVGIMACHSAFRFFYYGDVLPNTYYLKLTGVPLDVRLARGIATLWEFVLDSSLFVMAIPLVLFSLLPPKRTLAALLLLPVAIQCAYSAYIGGDAWDWYGGANRYIVIVIPALFIGVCWAIAGILKRLDMTMGVAMARWRIDGNALVFGALVIYALVSFNSPHLLGLALVLPPLDVQNNEQRVREALFIRETTDSAAAVAVVWAGAIPYFSERNCIDMLGKNDRYIARLPVRKSEFFHPGHDKWDYSHSIITPVPDVVTQLWKEPQTIEPFLMTHYRRVANRGMKPLFFETRSSHIFHDKLPPAEIPGP